MELKVQKLRVIILIGVINLVISDELISLDGKSILQAEILSNNGLSLRVLVGEEVKLSATIGNDLSISKVECSSTNCVFSGSEYTTLSITSFYDYFQVKWSSDVKSSSIVFNDCFDLNKDEVSWYGGPEVLATEWPIEKLTFKDKPYISSRLENGAVVEPYWLNSKGGFILIDEFVPLFVDQNNEQDNVVCFSAADAFPFNETEVVLSYTLAAKDDPKEAHIFAVNNFLGKPAGLPDVRMVREPIWTTWGKYKINVDDATVLDYLQDIYEHNFTKGQIEIDDKWEVCYGDQTFDTEVRFPDIKNTVATIHSYGFRATLWTHPFVNAECDTPVTEGFENEYFVNNTNGDALTFWWNGNYTYVIDFTKPSAADWFKERLFKIRDDYNIDGFKCDAGESDWLPINHIFHGKSRDAPRSFTTLYMNTCAQLGTLVEVRSTYRTQNLTVFVRMLDKDSVWGKKNGLRALVHALLQFNMIGYTYVLPDLIGGNGYNSVLPSAELLVRWTQANAFMPSIQFSYLPWDLDKAEFDTTEIVRKFVDLHEKYSDIIIDAMNNSVTAGIPVNPPVWWVDPTDPVALKVEDEFLLGDKILVAPVLDEGATSRDIYLPNGRWEDGNTGTIYEGRQTLVGYAAPIDVLPYFFRL